MAVEAQELALSFPGEGRTLFDSLSFTIGDGEIAAATGPSGCGKTLLGLALSGYLPLRTSGWELSGRITLNGADIIQGEHTGAGVCLENPYTQLSGMKHTVLHELAFPLESHGIDRESMLDRAVHYATETGIGHLLGQSVHTLSGGELQRLHIASTLVTEPPFLFLDRPLTEIDPASRQSILRTLQRSVERTEAAALLADYDAGPYGDVIISSVGLGTEAPLGGIHALAPAASPTPLLEVHSLAFSYDGGPSLFADLTLTVGAGECLLLEGPNGCGKTTLAKTILGILTPSTGTMLLAGKPLTSLPETERFARIGLSLQNPSLHLCRSTVADELALARRWGHDPGELAGILGLDDLGGNHPLELTQAEKKRLGFALAAGEGRRLVILDEPTQYQDSTGFHMVREGMQWCLDSGLGILLISHDERCRHLVPESRIIRLSRAGSA